MPGRLGQPFRSACSSPSGPQPHGYLLCGGGTLTAFILATQASNVCALFLETFLHWSVWIATLDCTQESNAAKVVPVVLHPL